MSRRGLLPVDGRELSLAGGGLVTAFAVIVAMALAPAPARALSADTGSRNAGAPPAYSTSVSLRASSAEAKKSKSNGNCSVGQMLVAALNPFSNCQPLNQAGQALVNTVASLPGTIAGAAATGVMDQVTAWMVQAAQTISGWVVKEAGVITRPELDAAWYLNLFSGLAALGAALAGLVALIALGSAAIRKDPDALGEVIYGIGAGRDRDERRRRADDHRAQRRGLDQQRVRAADAGRLLQHARQPVGRERMGRVRRRGARVRGGVRGDHRRDWSCGSN